MQARIGVFKDETGIPSQPPYTTLARTVQNLVWDAKLPFPLNNTHGDIMMLQTGAAQYDKYYLEMIMRYDTASIDGKFL